MAPLLVKENITFELLLLIRKPSLLKQWYKKKQSDAENCSLKSYALTSNFKTKSEVSVLRKKGINERMNLCKTKWKWTKHSCTLQEEETPLVYMSPFNKGWTKSTRSTWMNACNLLPAAPVEHCAKSRCICMLVYHQGIQTSFEF